MLRKRKTGPVRPRLSMGRGDEPTSRGGGGGRTHLNFEGKTDPSKRWILAFGERLPG